MMNSTYELPSSTPHCTWFFFNDCCLKQLVAVMMVMWMIIIDRITYYPSIRCLWFILTLFLMILMIYCDHTYYCLLLSSLKLFHLLIMMILISNQSPIIWFMIMMWMVIKMMFNDDEGGSGVTGADSRPVWLAWFEPRRLLEPLVSAGRDGGCCFPQKTSAKQGVLGGRPSSGVFFRNFEHTKDSSNISNGARWISDSCDGFFRPRLVVGNCTARRRARGNGPKSGDG